MAMAGLGLGAFFIGYVLGYVRRANEEHERK